MATFPCILKIIFFSPGILQYLQMSIKLPGKKLCENKNLLKFKKIYILAHIWKTGFQIVSPCCTYVSTVMRYTNYICVEENFYNRKMVNFPWKITWQSCLHSGKTSILSSYVTVEFDDTRIYLCLWLIFLFYFWSVLCNEATKSYYRYSR